MRLAALLASVLALGVIADRAAVAQIQSGGPFAGAPGPPESPKNVSLKTGICNKAANKYKLRGPDRKKYLDQCLHIRYSDDFKPPDWPLPPD
jgi:hypothetical protein